MSCVTFADIEAARVRIAGAVYASPCPESIPLSEVTGMQIFCKLENLQRTGSFKERGARNALALLTPEQAAGGVITASAGNHALGLAYHGRLLSIPVTVVMPRFAPLIKVSNCQRLGARVELHGASFAEAMAYARALGHEQGLTYIHGYDDPAIIAGQGTMALEILEQVPDIDAIVIPVGGAGLLAGIALAVKTLQPQIRLIGVEPEGAAKFAAAARMGAPVQIQCRPTLADGLAKLIGEAGASIQEIVHDRAFTGGDVFAVSVLCTIETRDRAHLEELFARLEREAIPHSRALGAGG
jgi:threonine dehydratase